MTAAIDPSPTTTPAWPSLSAAVYGSVVLPDDAGFAAAVTPWNVAVPCTPAALVRVASADDVVATVRFALAHGLRVEVRATGHGAAPVTDDVVLVHTGGLDALEVHAEGWARVGAGVRWEAVIAAAAPHGLAPVCGSAPGVGVVGFLTGGGLGPTARTHGLGSDHVRAFEVVTGDGVLHRVTVDRDPQLFRGLLGGKGAAGIVTAVEIDLVAQSTVFGGCLYYDGADIAAVVHAWRRWSEDLPEQATTSLAVLNLPPLPSVPGPLAGQRTVAVRVVWTGADDDGARLVAPLLDVAPVVFGGVGTMPFAAIGMVHADPVDPMPVAETTLLLRGFGQAAADRFVELTAGENPQVVTEIRQMGGAVARRPERGDSVSHRGAGFAVLTIGIAAPPVLGATIGHAQQVAVALSPWTHPGTLPNFGGAATAQSVGRHYDTATLARLAALVTAHDPRAVLTAADAVRAAAARQPAAV